MALHNAKKPRRTRTRNVVVRLNDEERATLDRVTAKLGLASISDAVRFLVKREDDAKGSRELVATLPSDASEDDAEAFAGKLADFFVGVLREQRKKKGLPPLPKDAPKKKKRPRR